MISKIRPGTRQLVVAHSKAKVEMKAWNYALLTSGLLLSCASLIYVLFSKVGLAYSEDVVSPDFWTYFISALIICVLTCMYLHYKIQPIYNRYIERRYTTNKE